MALPSISVKMSRVMQIILLSFLGIGLRVWHLEFIQREEKQKEAQKPQQRTLLLRADRGTICDRFHIPLALNRISYNAAIYYGQIAQIPTVCWKTDAEGKKVRSYARKEYIRDLAQTLAQTLSLDPERVEDLIHSKASLFPHVPYIVKTGISEEEHYRLRMLEKDWAGIHAEITAERFYPQGKTASNLVGTMGAINQKEFTSIAEEISLLQEAIDQFEMGGGFDFPPGGYGSFEEVAARLSELKEKAYAINDLVGKTGIEGRFEEDLRGFFGKKSFEVDQKGRLLRELPGGRASIPGQQVILSISAELQQFAEALLTQNEKIREGRSLGIDPTDKKRKVQKQPWIKGGAIVALDPNTGEVLALASHPRFDPNDFIPSPKKDKQSQAARWLESERFIGSVWDGRDCLTRERSSGPSKPIFEETRPLTWEFYLDSILPAEGPLRTFFHRVDDVKSAIQIQEDFDGLLYFSKTSDPRLLMDILFPETGAFPKSTSRQSAIESLKESAADAAPLQKRLEAYLHGIPSNSDKLFAIDLCRMAVYSPAFSDPLIVQCGAMKLGIYRSHCQTAQRLEEELKRSYQQQFHGNEFKNWRAAHQKTFLAEKRKEEKEKKTYARPYIDYLDQKEKELFHLYWEENRLSILVSHLCEKDPNENEGTLSLRDLCKRLSPELSAELLRSFRSFSQLDRPLLGHYKNLRKKNQPQLEKDLAAAFYPVGGFGFSRSFGFQSGVPQGSLFKLVTAYEGLIQGNSLSLIDELGQDPRTPAEKGQIVAYTLNRSPYPRYYKGGRLPKSSTTQIGKIDLAGALEQSSNPYFAILAGDCFKDPEDLCRAAALFGYGEKTGIDLPGETKGNLPNDLKTNRTGLYSSAIGQHTLLCTPLQAAGMLSAIANGGRLMKPKLVKEEVGFSPDSKPLSALGTQSFFAQEELAAIGIQFPLFTSIQSRDFRPSSSEQPNEVRRTLLLPPALRSQLLEGMDRVVWGTKGSARPNIIKSLIGNPLLARDYLSLQHQMIGKTGTAEILYNPYFHPSSKPQVYKHVWFGAISFAQESPLKTIWDHPELVVVVFFRYGDAGKEAAPLAAQMIKKWREIKKKQKTNQTLTNDLVSEIKI